MITDSQVGIPRPTWMRRNEQKPRATLLGLVTEHWVAKIVAFLFAAVLIVLIDRELETVLLNKAEFDVRVGDSARAAADFPGRRQIVLETEPGVAVRFKRPEQVHVLVTGPEKLRDRFTSKTLVAIVQIKQSWLNKTGGNVAVRRTIDGSIVQFPGVRGATVTLDPPIEVELEAEVVKDMPLVPIPIELAHDLRADVTFKPPTVRVLGPASLLEGPGAIEGIKVPIRMTGKREAFEQPVTLLSEEYVKTQIRMAPDQQIVAAVKFAKGTPATLEVRDLALQFLVSPETRSDYDTEIVGDPPPRVTVTLSGSAQAVASWRERAEELRRRIKVAIDVEKLVSDASPQPGTPTKTFAPVEVFGIPADLALDDTRPGKVDVSVTKRDS